MATTSSTFKSLARRLEELAERTGASVFITRVTDTHVVLDAVAGPLEAKYPIGDAVPRQNRKQYCEYVVENGQALFVRDASADTLWAIGLDVEFDLTNYLGYPVYAADGTPFGTVCYCDSRARDYGEAERSALEALARDASALLRDSARGEAR